MYTCVHPCAESKCVCVCARVCVLPCADSKCVCVCVRPCAYSKCVCVCPCADSKSSVLYLTALGVFVTGDNICSCMLGKGLQ